MQYLITQLIEVKDGIASVVKVECKQLSHDKQSLLDLALSHVSANARFKGYEQVRRSQYIGYRLKSYGSKQHQYLLVFTPRRDRLVIYSPLPSEAIAPLFPHLYEKVCHTDEEVNKFFADLLTFLSAKQQPST